MSIRLVRPLFALVLIAALGTALVGCSDDDVGQGDTREGAGAKLQEGLRAHAEGDLETAEAAYLETIRLDPENKYAYYNLGVIAQTQGDPETAAANYRSALDVDADFVPALFNLAILVTESDPQEAMDLYEHIVEVDDAYAAAYLNLGFLLLEEGRVNNGERMLARAVELDPSLASRIGSDSEGEPVPGPTGPTG
jgi:Tfp pilus assembly protein PilF